MNGGVWYQARLTLTINGYAMYRIIYHVQGYDLTRLHGVSTTYQTLTGSTAVTLRQSPLLSSSFRANCASQEVAPPIRMLHFPLSRNKGARMRGRSPNHK